MNVKEIFKVGAILFLITALSAALLGFVNAKTAPLIEENNAVKEQEALKAVLPEATSFEEIELSSKITDVQKDRGSIIKAYIAKGGDGKNVGACVITETKGYDKGIQTVTGVDMNNTVSGVEIIAMNETPGLGAKSVEPEFRDRYKGKNGEIGVSKTETTDTEIQAISGATLTSKGVTNGVNMALDAAKIILEGGAQNG